MIFPIWSEPIINPVSSNSSSKSKNLKPLKKKISSPKQLEIDFNSQAKFQVNTKHDFDELLKKLAKKIPIFSNNPDFQLTTLDHDVQLTTLDQHYDASGEIPFPKDDIQKYCDYYGIDSQNVVSFMLEHVPGSHIHKITIEKELF